MASTVSRDPVGGSKEGHIYADDFLTTGAEVTFSILKVSGGAKNPINRTTMETTHTGSCGDEFQVANLVSTWPPLRVELAIDDTGSMSNELSGLQIALANFIDSLENGSSDASREVSYELISFKDSPTLDLANTTDSNLAKSAVNALYPSGGGDCPEDSLGALSLALNNLTSDEDSDGEIVLVTDASPQAGNIDQIIATAQSLGVPVNVMLSGDCAESTTSTLSLLASVEAAAVLSARDVFKRIANETGGIYAYAPTGSPEDYAGILEEIFASAYTGDDDEEPVVTITVSPEEIWPPNHKMVEVVPNVTAIDNADPSPSIALIGVTSNEPEDGQGDGNTSGDIVIDEDGRIFVRAERSGQGNMRFYTITYKATDSSGNVGFGSADVVVPHDQN